jgi:hypothetical protein
MSKKLFFSLLTMLSCIASMMAQPAADSTTTATSGFTFGIFGDVYYLYDFNEPKDRERPGFVYAHSRHNEITLNNVVVSGKYSHTKVRANLGIHTGTYIQRNYAAEVINDSEVLKYIYEANAGVRLAKGLWLDAGIFPSHIGFESALSIDNPTLTRSLMAENTPYYETGAKLTYDLNDQWTFSALVLNGWQRIVETDNNKAVGTQIVFKPAEGILLNSSSFVGKEGTNRIFHNFYATFDLIDKVTLITAFDIGWQQKLNDAGDKDGYQTWWNPNIIVKYKPIDQFALAGRLEYYHDPHGSVITTQTDHGFQTWSPSLNVDYYPIANVALRLEGRYYQAKDPVFVKNEKATKTDALVITSLAFKF